MNIDQVGYELDTLRRVAKSLDGPQRHELMRLADWLDADMWRDAEQLRAKIDLALRCVTDGCADPRAMVAGIGAARALRAIVTRAVLCTPADSSLHQTAVL